MHTLQSDNRSLHKCAMFGPCSWLLPSLLCTAGNIASHRLVEKCRGRGEGQGGKEILGSRGVDWQDLAAANCIDECAGVCGGVGGGERWC